MVDAVKQNCSLLFFIQFLYKTFQLLWTGVSALVAKFGLNSEESLVVLKWTWHES